MSGTVEGGKRAAATNKQKYGASFYETIGRMGGKKSSGGGFAKATHEQLQAWGRMGGSKSRKPKSE